MNTSSTQFLLLLKSKDISKEQTNKKLYINKRI